MRYLKDYFHSSGWFWPTFVLVLLRPTMVSLYFLCRSYIQVYHKQINDDIKTWRADCHKILNKVLHHNFPSFSNPCRMPLSLDLGTPINTALFLYILYSVQHIIFPPILKTKTTQHDFRNGYKSWMPKAHQPTILFKIYTPKMLAAFSGHDRGRILLAINGIVFDVTAGRNFYGPRTFLSNPSTTWPVP